MAPELERAARKRDSLQALLETQKESEQAQGQFQCVVAARDFQP